MKRVNFVAAALAALVSSAVAPAYAGDVQPGDYVYAGDGRTLFIVYGQHQRSKTFDNGVTGQVPESKTAIDALILRAVHYREIAGHKLAFHAIAPIAKFNGMTVGGMDVAHDDGLGDLTLGVTYFPTTSDAETGTTFGASLFVTAPSGDFSVDRPSFGTGTWSLTPQVGVVQGLGNGYYIDASAEATIYRDTNHDGVRVARKDTAQVQAYLRYQWDEATAFSLGYSAKSGGARYDNGVFTGNKTRSEQIRLVASKFVTPTSQVQMMLGKDTIVKGGFKAEPLVQVRFTSVF